MGMDNKDLILALAKEAGIVNDVTQNRMTTRYDMSTGTLYCKGYVISKGIIDSALDYFKQQEAMYAKNETKEGRDMMMAYSVAVQAITMMKNGDFSTKELNEKGNL